MGGYTVLHKNPYLRFLAFSPQTGDSLYIQIKLKFGMEEYIMGSLSHVRNLEVWYGLIENHAAVVYVSSSQPVGRGPKVGRDREFGGPCWSLKAVQKSQTILEGCRY